jgi:ankyrin repeat protein
LTLYAGRRDAKAVRALLAAGADPNAGNRADLTPLLAAVRSSAGLDTVRLLLSAGADPNFRGPGGETALMTAVVWAKTDLVCELLAAGANPEARDETGMTALMLAERKRRNPDATPNIVKALLDAGADPNLADNEGLTALHHGAREGDLESVKLLLAAGANPGIEARNGRTPIVMAAQTGPRGTSTGSAARLEMVRMLLAATAPERRDQELSAALVTARRNNDFGMQKLLWELGARDERSYPSGR